MLAAVRVAWIGEAVGLYRTGKVTYEDAADWLGMSERHFQRLRDRYDAQRSQRIIDWHR